MVTLDSFPRASSPNPLMLQFHLLAACPLYTPVHGDESGFLLKGHVCASKLALCNNSPTVVGLLVLYSDRCWPVFAISVSLGPALKCVCVCVAEREPTYFLSLSPLSVQSG